MRKTTKKKKVSKATLKRQQRARNEVRRARRVAKNAKKLGTRKLSIPWGSMVMGVLATPETRGLAGDLLKGVGKALRESADESIATREKEAKPDLRLVDPVYGRVPEKK